MEQGANCLEKYASAAQATRWRPTSVLWPFILYQAPNLLPEALTLETNFYYRATESLGEKWSSNSPTVKTYRSIAYFKKFWRILSWLKTIAKVQTLKHGTRPFMIWVNVAKMTQWRSSGPKHRHSQHHSSNPVATADTENRSRTQYSVIIVYLFALWLWTPWG